MRAGSAGWELRVRTGGARLAQRGQRRVGAEGAYTHRRVGAEGMYRRRSYDWCATNSAPSRSRSSASSEPCNLLSSHSMDQHSHHTQAVRVNNNLICTFCHPMFHFMVRDARACSTALHHKSSAITISSRSRISNSLSQPALRSARNKCSLIWRGVRRR